MTRVQIDLPETFPFSTDLEITIGMINYGGHLGNDSILTLAHEARIRFLKNLGYTELDVEGLGLIMADAAIQYRAEAFHGQVARIEIAIAEPSRLGFDLVYRLTDRDSQKEIARIKTGMVFFDYMARKVARTPEAFSQKTQSKS